MRPSAIRDLSPVRVAVIDPDHLVVAGLSELLLRFPGRAEFIDSSGCLEVDVVLYGVDDKAMQGHDARLHALLRTSPATVIAFGWNQDSPSALIASACGVRGFANKQLPAEQLVVVIEQLQRSRRRDGDQALPDAGQCQCHAGVQAGLSQREFSVLALIAGGQTNSEIADDLYLSINSVKTYIRSAYRKIGVTRRSQAVAWAWRYGLGTLSVDEPEPAPLVEAKGA